MKAGLYLTPKEWKVVYNALGFFLDVDWTSPNNPDLAVLEKVQKLREGFQKIPGYIEPGPVPLVLRGQWVIGGEDGGDERVYCPRCARISDETHWKEVGWSSKILQCVRCDHQIKPVGSG